MFKNNMICSLPLCVVGIWLIIAYYTTGTSSASQDRDNFLQSAASPCTNGSACLSNLQLHLISAAGHKTRGDSTTQVDHRDRAYRFFSGLELFKGQLTVAELELASITTRHLYNVYDEVAIQKYDSFALFRQSTGPHIDQELCIKQLRQLNVRANVWLREKSQSLDLNLYQLLDTYGRAPAGVASCNNVWPGVYESCLAMSIDTPKGPKPTRYCLASVKRRNWPQGDSLSKISAFKLGVCLPKACDSTRYDDKYELIERLMSLNARHVDQDQMYLDDLYCLPDEDSPLRQWWKSPERLQAFIVIGLWLVVLAYATIKYEQLRGRSRIDQGRKAGSEDETGHLQVYQLLAVTANLKTLFRTGEGEEAEEKDGNKARVEQGPVIDFKCLNGIKVICMCYILLGHIIMCISTLLINSRELVGSMSPAWIASNMMPAFAVNAFFVITGLLTCYTLLKQNESHSFMTNPLKWIMIFLYRYLRIMPMYAVAVYLCKYIIKYIGSGPMWDYGTSSLAHRRRCEEESWLWTLLFGANLKSPFEHCIPSAWYLANDFQFFLVTPIFMITLHRNEQLGKRILKLSILTSYLATIMSFLLVDADVRPIIQFMPHGFATYVDLFTSSYTLPHYRIAAYLSGLLMGHYLYHYEQRKQSHLANVKPILALPKWPDWMLDHGLRLVGLFFVLVVLGPIAGARIPLSKPLAHAVVAFAVPTYHIGFALITGLYILLAATGHGNQQINSFLSSSMWKPLARLSLCVLLINIEVINYITQDHQVNAKFFPHSALILLSIFSSYIVATVLYVIFEAPLRGLLVHLLNRSVSKLIGR